MGRTTILRMPLSRLARALPGVLLAAACGRTANPPLFDGGPAYQGLVKVYNFESTVPIAPPTVAMCLTTADAVLVPEAIGISVPDCTQDSICCLVPWREETWSCLPHVNAGTLSLRDDQNLLIEVAPSTPDQIGYPSGVYTVSPQLFAGDVLTFAASGGSDIPAISGQITIPDTTPILTPITMPFDTRINSNQDLLVTWFAGTTPDPDARFTVGLFVTTVGTVACHPPVSDGTVRIPSDLLAKLRGRAVGVAHTTTQIFLSRTDQLTVAAPNTALTLSYTYEYYAQIKLLE